jgi:toxin CcdB
VAQFDVYRLPDGVLVVDLQTDLIGLDATRIAAPLRAEGAYARFPGLTPTVEIEGRRWIVRLQELGAVPAAELRTRIGSIAEVRDELKRGLDILIDGF